MFFKRKHLYNSVFAVLVSYSLICSILICSRVWADDSASIIGQIKQVDGDDMSGQVTVRIHTGNEIYYVEGILEILQEGTDGHETVMEVQGSIEKIENAEKWGMYEQPAFAEPTALTVYMGNEIYGFYSTRKLVKSEDRNELSVDYYGYLEGYAGGENHYSTFNVKGERTMKIKSKRYLSIVGILGITLTAVSISTSVRAEKSNEEITVIKETAEPDSYVINDFPMISQMPELPTGCEITALTMVLNYYGYSVDKVQMAEKYLPTLASADVYMGDDGRLYGNDMRSWGSFDWV